MLIRPLTALCLILTAACGQEATETPAAAPTAAGNSSAAAPAALERRPAPAGAIAYFIEPADGATVSSPVHIAFGLSGAGVAPAGTVKDGTGHHHLLVDTGLPDLNLPIPSDETHRHFGGGQTETDIELAPGTHTLQLLLGDDRHVPHDPPIMSARITITVR
jgi:hypothetical protein